MLTNNFGRGYSSRVRKSRVRYMDGCWSCAAWFVCIDLLSVIYFSLYGWGILVCQPIILVSSNVDE